MWKTEPNFENLGQNVDNFNFYLTQVINITNRSGCGKQPHQGVTLLD